MTSVNYVLKLLLLGYNTIRQINKTDKFSDPGGFFFTIIVMCVGELHNDLNSISLLFIEYITLGVYIFGLQAKLDFCWTPNPIRDHGNVIICSS